ncbi:hypothetical protein KIH79_11165 [Bifidobacterium sp. 82T10]|uniref:Uncharacterized protein n=1 Tax=Bifidobacterium miconis TaxID=2834435 RepID=A0ABS6WIQ5_9BIFI|nr:hypothetical protein [Bifidobacterium miconis]MBW3093469.1 hypothetical protein [Bifidobacterium miconis]
MSVETNTAVSIAEAEANIPDMQPAEPDLPNFYGGDGPTSCMWEDGWCDELADHYILDYCDYEDCKDDHSTKYCLRHYVLRLGLILDHLKECPGMHDAGSPDEIRHCALEHIAGFGSLDLNDDRPAGQPVAPGATLPELSDLSDADLDASIERIGEQTAMSAGDWKELKVGDRLDRTTIEAWLNTLEFNHLDFRVEWFGEGGDDIAQPVVHRYDERMEQPDDWALPHVDDGWTFDDMNHAFDAGDFTPMVNATFDVDDGRVTRSYASDVLMPGLADRHHQITDDPDKALEWVIGIRETRTDSLIPVYPGAWIRWRAEYDGDFNQLDVQNWHAYRKRIAPYIEYWDESRPLNEAAAKAKARELETALRRIIRDGVKPAK